MSRLPLLVVALCAFVRADAAPQSKPIVIALGDISDVTGQHEAEPLRRLSQSLNQYPRSHRFRLIWANLAGNFGTNATALYDRRTGTFKFYSDTSIGGMGNEEISNDIKHWMFSGVSDSAIRRLERKHRGVLDSDKGTVFDGASFFSELGNYGAKRRDLGSRQVLSDYGKAQRRNSAR